jgi:hypothetical protein
MFNAIKEFIFGKPPTAPAPVNPQITDAVTQAPYKVPEPEATTPIPLVKLDQESPTVPMVEAVVEFVPVPVVEAAPAKKPRKPRAPKAVAEKPAAKKAALVKKAAAIKATTKARSKKA